MRRAALARWLNLSVIAAVIAVLTLVLVSGTTRVAYAADRCGSVDGTSPAPSEDTTFTISDISPTSGQPAIISDPVETTAAFADYTDQFSVLDWRLIGNPESGDPRIIEADFIDNFESMGVFFMIPADAPPGPLSLSVCYALSDGSGGQIWYYSTNELVFTVEEYAFCDQIPEPILDPFASLTLFPEQGNAGDTFTGQAFGGSFGGGDDSVAIENAEYLVMYWDWVGPGSAADGQVIYRDSHAPGQDVFLSDLPVPNDALPGEHVVSICYLVETEGGYQWWYTQSPPDPPPDGPQDNVFYTVLHEVPDINTCTAENNDPSLTLSYLDEPSPQSGPPGSMETARLFDDSGLQDVTYSLIWDFGSPDPFVLANNTPSEPEQADLSIPFVVPYDATIGSHTIGVCYLVLTEEGFEWVSGNNTIEFIVTDELAMCGGDDFPDIENGVLVTLVPNSGFVGDTFSTNVDGSEQGSEAFHFRDAYLVQVIWDYIPSDGELPASGIVLQQVIKPDDESNLMSIPGSIVPDTAPGTYDVTVCYFIPDDLSTQNVGPAEVNQGVWVVANVDEYTVLDVPTATPTPTAVPPTNTPTATVVPPTDTPTSTVVPPTNTPTPTVLPPTNTPTSTAVPPTNTPTSTVVPPTNTPTSTVVPPTNTPTSTVIPGTSTVPAATSTPTAVPPTATPVPPTATPVPPTATTPPDVDPPAPTATFTATAIPTETPTVAPTSTPVIPPTIAIVGTSTAVVGPADGGTPPPGGTGGAPGGTGGGPGGQGGTGGGTGAPGGGTTINPNTGAQETTTPGSPTAAPTTPTVAPTGTPSSTTPTPTPTPAPSATQSPTDDVLGARSEWVQSVPSFDELTDDFDVLLTNALLTGLFLILIFLTAEIFNQTIRDNQGDVESWMRNFFGPVIGFWGALSAGMGVATLGSQKLRDLFWLGIVLVITVLIEGFLEPDFSLNKESLLLFLSLLVAVGLVTYLTEGGEALIARGFGQDAAVRVFPAAIGIALICVIMSRLGGFIPGILYGFVGTAVFLRASTLNRDQTGKMIFFPMMLMLGLSVGAWLLVDQFRGPNPSDLDVFIEGILIGVFIATIEGVAINMLPIAYMDGRKLIDWNPLVWFATAGVALFLVWTVLLNDQREYFDSLQETTSLVAIIAVVACFGLSVVTWLWFRYRPGGHA